MVSCRFGVFLAATILSVTLTTPQQSHAQANASLFAMCPLDVRVGFTEGAPKDMLRIENHSQADWEVLAITVDLRSANGQLYFDTAAGGKGSSYHQLVRREQGSAKPQWFRPVADGSTEMTLNFREFQPGSHYQVSFDVDSDVTEGTATTFIQPAELNGAFIRAMLRGPNGVLTMREGQFNENYKARIAASNGCAAW